MLRFLSRLFGLVLLAGAMVAAIADGAASIGASRIVVLPFGAIWIAVSPDTLEAARDALVGIQPVLWDPILSGILAMPAFAVLGILAFLFLWAGRRRRDPYAPDERER